jgi:hypothetical protein
MDCTRAIREDRPTGSGVRGKWTRQLPPSAEAFRDALRVYEIDVATLRGAARETTSADFVLSIGREA